jgi:hypothetical protein
LFPSSFFGYRPLFFVFFVFPNSSSFSLFPSSLPQTSFSSFSPHPSSSSVLPIYSSSLFSTSSPFASVQNRALSLQQAAMFVVDITYA